LEIHQSNETVVDSSIALDEVYMFGTLFAYLQEISVLLLLVNKKISFGTILGNIGLPGS
jgi:hypothetical protein